MERQAHGSAHQPTSSKEDNRPQTEVAPHVYLDSRESQRLELVLLCLAMLLLCSHWLHLAADPPSKVGWFGARDLSADLYTDEGWASAGATNSVLRGHWHVPGDFNLSVDAPMWSILLYLPFKVFGPSIVVARALAAGLYFATIVGLYVLVKRSVPGISAALLSLVLAANFFGLVFGRLATMESAWVFFVVAALLAAQSGMGPQRSLLALVAGLLVGLAVLTKLTAAFAIAPVLLTLYLGLGRTKAFWQRAGAALLGLALVSIPYRIIALHRYAADHKFYTRINLEDRKITSVKAGVRHMLHVILALRAVDLALYSCCVLGIILACWYVAKKRIAPSLAWIALVWLVCNIAAVSTVIYFPLRYCFSFLFPIAVLSVVLAQWAYDRSRSIGIVLYALIGVSSLLNVSESLRYELRPSDTYRDMCRAIAGHISEDRVDHPQIMGTFANTISLYTAVPSLNDSLGTTPVDERIKKYSPSYYVSTGPASPEIQDSFAESGETLRLEERRDVLGDYTSGQPVYFYKVEGK